MMKLEKMMFEVIQKANATEVRTTSGVFTIRYSTEHRRYQVFKPNRDTVFQESYAEFQGALNIVDRLSR